MTLDTRFFLETSTKRAEPATETARVRDRKVFRRVALHLNDKGQFVFDVNTIGILQRLAGAQASVRQFDRDMVVIRVISRRRAYFKQVKVIDPEGFRPSDRSERLYFVCQDFRH